MQPAELLHELRDQLKRGAAAHCRHNRFCRIPPAAGEGGTNGGGTGGEGEQADVRGAASLAAATAWAMLDCARSRDQKNA